MKITFKAVIPAQPPVAAPSAKPDLSPLDLLIGDDLRGVIGRIPHATKRSEWAQDRRMRRESMCIERRSDQLASAQSRRDQLLLGRVSLGAGAAGYLSQHAQFDMHIKRLVLSSANLASIDLTSFCIGSESVFPNALHCHVPGEAFAFHQTGVSAGIMQSVMTGMKIRVGLENCGHEATSVAGVLFY